MKRIFGAKNNKEPPPSIQDASDRINKRGESVEDKVKRLDAELCKYKDQIKRTRPGPAQEAIKARAMRVLKQKKMYEGQRDMLYNQTFNLDQVSFAAEGLKDAQQTMTALKSANKELKGMMKTVKIQDIDNLQDEMMDLMDVSRDVIKGYPAQPSPIKYKPNPILPLTLFNPNSLCMKGWVRFDHGYPIL
ncbi:Vacuolar protein sorting-associated protein 60.2 [Hirschfeldia incana]|nr:Vacuolar protein sorting-associated protein 60.2 [Hirschfeldia incana]KAJ0235193.1 Vacuolar protein sorting-associated protein 60.2 [Hirschfeldia incana]